MGVHVNPMTKASALEILNIDVDKQIELFIAANPDVDEDEIEFDGICPKHVMERFDILVEKNSSEREGSFYMRSKIYFAKEELMSEFDASLNHSQFNPGMAAFNEVEPEE
jgi:hypothetical protein